MGADVRNGSGHRRGDKDVAEAIQEAMAATAASNESTSSAVDEDEESDDDGSEDDDEPALKYLRLGKGVDEVLARETISSLTTTDKFIGIGTHNGAAFVLKADDGTVLHKWKSHTATVNHIELDAQSQFVACASMDGRVTVRSLFSDEHAAFDLKRPVQSVSLEPAYARRSTRQCVSGGLAGILTLHEKGWLGHKETTIYQGDGPIWTTTWRGNYIAWASDAGIRIYDTASSSRIAFLPRQANSPRADLYPCTLRWTSDSALLSSWADTIKMINIKTRERPRGLNNAGLGGTESFAEVTAVFQVDCLISGIALHARGFLILAYPVPEDAELDSPKRPIGSKPELRIISKEGEEVSNDVLGLRGFERYQCRDYHLVSCAEVAGRFFVSAPTDLVVASDRDDDDHVDWLIENGRYQDALTDIENRPRSSSRFDVHQVGLKYLQHLLDTNQFEQAAASLKKILGYHAKEWEDWIFLFAGKGQLSTVVPHVPTHDPQLSRVVYELILGHYMQHDRPALLKAVQTWPAGIYDASAIILAIHGALEQSPKDASLLKAAAHSHTTNRQPGKALPFLLKLRDPAVFDFVRQHNLASQLSNQVLEIVEFDSDVSGNRKDAPKHGQAIDLLVAHTDSIPVAKVVEQLEGHSEYLYRYLDALFATDAHLGCDYSDLQVSLYAQYEPEQLLTFLRASNYYSLEAALRVCEKHDLVPEQVFLLGRMGDNKRALRLVISRLGDVDRAIDFATEQNDAELWQDLLDYAEERPMFIKALLERTGLQVDPVSLISRIKKGVEIPGLKPALIKILQDANLRLSLMHGCLAIMGSDVRAASQQYRSQTRNGSHWNHTTSCKSCEQVIYPHLDGVSPMPAECKSAIRFLCGHTYDLEHALSGSASDIDLAVDAIAVPSRKRGSLVAEHLMRRTADGGSSNNGTELDRASAHKVRLVADLRSTMRSSSSSSKQQQQALECKRCAAQSAVLAS